MVNVPVSDEVFELLWHELCAIVWNYASWNSYCCEDLFQNFDYTQQMETLQFSDNRELTEVINC